LQILDCSNSAIVSSGPRERRPDPTSGGWREQGGGIHHPASANYIPQESAAHPRLTAGVLAFAERLWRSVKYEEARRNDHPVIYALKEIRACLEAELLQTCSTG
jgi:hypothetical protein